MRVSAVGRGVFGLCQWHGGCTEDKVWSSLPGFNETPLKERPAEIEYSLTNACGGLPNESRWGCGRFMCAKHLSHVLEWHYPVLDPEPGREYKKEIRVCEYCYRRINELD